MSGKPEIDETCRARYEAYESEHWHELSHCVDLANLGLKEVMMHAPAFIRRRELARLLAHYELFKLIADMPGSIVELGVYLGAGFFTWSKLLETFNPGDRGRKVYGFESCSGYDSFRQEDGECRPWIDRLIGSMKPGEEYLQGMVNLHNNDNFLRGVERCKLIQGDIRVTVEEFAKEALGTRLSLLYFDVNVFEPTLTGLRHLYPLVLSGGVVAFNAYGSPPWAGEAKAIETYFTEIDRPIPRMSKFPFSIYPNAYFIKQ
ncbi:MAG: TylF/MycF/NovP-related O-methyltransferase [Candidatus Accumulibacter sp. UW25]